MVIAVVGVAGAASAQATRTWVSGVGDDANPCSRTAPCKTFAGAISKTAASGEINVLDPGGYGAVTITKSISIEAEGELAGVLASGTNAIVVNAGASDVVRLRGLIIDGVGTGLNGISFLAGGALHVEKCTINNFSQKGISFQPAGTSRLVVQDTSITRVANAVNGGGILIKPGAGVMATALLDDVTIDHTLFGVRAEDRSTVDIRGMKVVGASGNGIIASSAADPVKVMVESSTVTGGTGGVASLGAIKSSGAGASVWISGVTLFGSNTAGLVSVSGGQIISFADNRVEGNAPNGLPTGIESFE